ncbi:MAG TPA: protein kinase [Thermoanaerobaculia bacterium]
MWPEIRRLFQAAIDLPPQERAAWLDRECSDADIRKEVDALLASHDAPWEAVDRLERRSFRPGERIANRYEIVGLLGSGGMGEVYEARDAYLEENVALKIVRPELAPDDRALLRFKREIQLARKVTHPNVCRIFDVSQSESSIAFVSMELLSGETLAERLDRTGRLPVEEALPIVRQLAEGLAAAHDAGIVHRDFKSANVMLVGSRAVITDFGLALQTGERSALTDPGTMMGTPDYMSPEQVESGDVSAASDVYALGIVMFEMVTGKLPFHGNTAYATAMSRLQKAAPTPRTLVPALDAKWESVILRCLERDPSRRFTSSREVVRALEEGGPKFTRSTRQRFALFALLALIFATVVGVAKWWPRTLETPAAAVKASFAPRRAFAVTGFRNLSNRGEGAWLGDAFAEMLASELAAGEKLRAIPSESVQQLGPKNLGADLLVGGTYVVLPDGKLRLDARVQDAGSGETVATVSEAGSEAELIDVVSRAGARLRTALGVADISDTAAVGLRASKPSNPEAVRFYTEGLAKLRRFDARGARTLFEQAIEREPDFPLAYDALAQALWVTGYEAEARDAARKAFDLSTHLERAERLQIEGRYYHYSREWEKAIEILGSLRTFFPDDLTYGLALAQVQINASKAKDALDTVVRLRELPPPLRDDPRIDLAEADAAQSLTEYERELRVARAAEEKGKAAGARLIIARARMNQGFAFSGSGNTDLALASLRGAEEMFRAAGDEGGRGRAVGNMANILMNRGEIPAAEVQFTRALEIQRRIGNRAQEAQTLTNLSILAFMRGDLAECETIAREAYELARAIDHRRIMGSTLTNIGAVQQLQGRLDEATQTYASAAAVAKTIGDQATQLDAVVNTAEVLRWRGELAASRARYDEGVALARKLGRKKTLAYALAGLGELAFAEGKLAEARARYDESLAIDAEVKDALSAALARLALASLDLAEGRADAAANAARAAAADLRARKAKDGEAAAMELLARALLAQGKRAEAEAAIAAAPATSDVNLRLAISITQARILGGAAGKALLRRAAEEARTKQLALPAFEARLALAEVTADQAARAAVARDAQARGYALIAQRAR